MVGSTTLQSGVIALALAAFLLFYLIPTWVAAPGAVPRLVLSPLFWPNILAVGLALVGGALVVAGLREPPPDEPLETVPARGADRGALRLLAMAGLMLAYFLLIPQIGMPFASMLAFAGVAALMLARDWVVVLAAAVILPLLLYAFFAHVASVAIPQAPFFRLP